MREILFIAHRLPWPPDRGDKIRSHNILRHLAGTARVHLVTFAEDAQELAAADDLKPLVASLHVELRNRSRALGVARSLVQRRAASLSLFDSTMMHRTVARVLKDHDIGTTFVFSGQMAQFVPAGHDTRFVMDFVDVDSEKFRSYSTRGPLPLRWLYRREARLLATFEHTVAQLCDAALFVSESEAALFRSLTGLGPDKVRAVENGINLDHFSPEASFPSPDSMETRSRPLVVFTGQMDYPPNIEAVTDFAREVLPQLRAVRPSLVFAIVGRNPVSSVTALDVLPGVIVTGAVSDVRPWLAAADVVVAPLAIARGIQNKVLEAMAMARPVVASVAAAEGIDAQDGRDLIVAENDGMAPAILDLLAAPDKAKALGIAARLQVEGRYRWEQRLEPLTAMLAP